MNSDDTNYIQDTLGNVLAEALRDLYKARSDDPIEFLALWLFHYRDEQDKINEFKPQQAELLVKKQEYIHQMEEERKRIEEERIQREEDEKRRKIEAEAEEKARKEAEAKARAKEEEEDSESTQTTEQNESSGYYTESGSTQ